jgi:dihydroneopterin aldolase
MCVPTPALPAWPPPSELFQNHDRENSPQEYGLFWLPRRSRRGGHAGPAFLIDLVLSLDIAEAARTDDLNTTVDYAKVYALCRQIVEHDRVKLLETLANHIINRVLETSPRVTKVEIVIRKPSVPVGGALDYVAIETSRER